MSWRDRQRGDDAAHRPTADAAEDRIIAALEANTEVLDAIGEQQQETLEELAELNQNLREFIEQTKIIVASMQGAGGAQALLGMAQNVLGALAARRAPPPGR